jgi:hypothetical protein
LDSVLDNAFTGENAQTYISLLQELGPDNIFCKFVFAKWLLYLIQSLTSITLFAATTSEIVFMSYPSETTPAPAMSDPRIESQESDSLTNNSHVPSSLVATLVCALTAVLFVAFSFAYRRQKDYGKVINGDSGDIDMSNNDIGSSPATEAQTVALTDEGDVASTIVCSPGFDGAMLAPSARHNEHENRSSRPRDPLSPQPKEVYPKEPALFSQSIYSRRRGRYDEADHDTEEVAGSPEFDPWDERSPPRQEVLADTVAVGDRLDGDNNVHLLAPTESEDEDVPLRVVDLIRFFTPQRPLEPPGNSRGKQLSEHQRF